MNYTVYNRLLYRMQMLGSEAGEVSLRLCEPKSFWATVLRACYDDITASHSGETRTLEKVRQRFLGFGISSEVERCI